MERVYGFFIDLTTGEPVGSPTVTVYDSGTLNLSTLYEDNISTPRANPFTGASTGYWFFYAAAGRYDVVLSKTSYTSYTLADISTYETHTLNGLTTTTQTFATGTSGNDFAISSASSTHTFNLPNASATARGLVSTGSQTIAGAKTFSTPIAVGSGGTGLSSTPTNGQILIGNGTGYVLATITGTTNQLTVTGGASTITLSLPQDIASGSSPTFTGLTLSGFTASRLVETNGSKALTSLSANADGQILIGSSTGGSTKATLTQGATMTITNATLHDLIRTN